MKIDLLGPAHYRLVQDALANPERIESHQLVANQAFEFASQNWDFVENADHCSEPQAMLLSLCELFSAFNTDGLKDGVCSNRPYLIPLARETARELKLAHVLASLERLSAAVPVDELVEDPDLVDEIWEKDELQGELAEIDEMFSHNSFIDEINRAVTQLMSDHPGDFFVPPADLQ